MTTTLALVLTIYTGPIAAPLYCDTGVGLTYNPAATWIAWDFAIHGGECGDLIEIVHDGKRRTFRAALRRDAGRVPADNGGPAPASGVV